MPDGVPGGKANWSVSVKYLFKAASFGALATTIALFSGVANAGTEVSNNLANCRAGASSPAALVRVVGFKQGSGRVRVQSYSGADNWLETGEWLHRIDEPVRRDGADMTVCLPLPGPGSYGIAVRHDVDSDGSDWNDGGGFSNNPDISLFHLKPRYSRTAFQAGSGVTRLTIVLNYRRGTRIEPIG